MSGKAARIVLSEKQQKILQQIIRATTLPQRLLQRASVILRAFEGHLNEDIATKVILDESKSSDGADAGRNRSMHWSRLNVVRRTLHFGNWHVVEGQMISPTIRQTRTESDFAWHIHDTVQTDPDAGWVIVLDNLNVHCSVTLVGDIAELEGIDKSTLGRKGRSGILKWV